MSRDRNYIAGHALFVFWARSVAYFYEPGRPDNITVMVFRVTTSNSSDMYSGPAIICRIEKREKGLGSLFALDCLDSWTTKENKRWHGPQRFKDGGHAFIKTKEERAPKTNGDPKKEKKKKKEKKGR